ncbi:MAG TPA: terminase family protein [Bryobacteraceae bacterium]|nr:terminase family protein [Bryobacteraceae bacterium]
MGRWIRGGRCRQEIAYTPLPSQAKFHYTKSRYKGFSGPIGSGKSQALCHEAIRLAYVNAGRTGLVGAPTYPMLRDATQAAFLEILRENRIPYEQNRSENTITLEDCRSKILFRPLEDFNRLRGTNLAWYGVDELTYTPEGAWLRLEGRLRDPKATQHCGFAVWTPKGFDWVYERFIRAPRGGYEVVLATPGENRHVLQASPEFYDRLRHSYDEHFYRQEALGEYLAGSTDRVYSNFDRALHVSDVTPSAAEVLLWTLDFNVTPMCSLVAQRSGSALHVLDEIVLQKASTWDACEEFNRRYFGRFPGVIVSGDASGNHSQTSGTTDYQIIRTTLGRQWRSLQFQVPKANPLVRLRTALVNAKLKSAAGDVDIRISPGCRNLIKDLEEVAYKDGSGVIDKDRDPQRTHTSDALGYLVWQEFGDRQTIGEQNRRLL